MFLLVYFHFLIKNSWKKYIINRTLKLGLIPKTTRAAHSLLTRIKPSLRDIFFISTKHFLIFTVYPFNAKIAFCSLHDNVDSVSENEPPVENYPLADK